MAAGRHDRDKTYESPVRTILLGHPGFHGPSGMLLALTVQEFLRSCSEPSTNGLDAFVYEVPERRVERLATIRATGSSTAGEHDLDIYLYDAECTPLAAHNSAAQHETGLFPPGTAWVVLHNFAGGPVAARYTLTPWGQKGRRGAGL